MVHGRPTRFLHVNGSFFICRRILNSGHQCLKSCRTSCNCYGGNLHIDQKKTNIEQTLHKPLNQVTWSKNRAINHEIRLECKNKICLTATDALQKIFMLRKAPFLRPGTVLVLALWNLCWNSSRNANPIIGSLLLILRLWNLYKVVCFFIHNSLFLNPCGLSLVALL